MKYQFGELLKASHTINIDRIECRIVFLKLIVDVVLP